MSKSFEPRLLCSKIHSSPHSCIPKFCAIFWEFFPKYFYHQNPFIQFLILFLIQKSIKIDFSFYSFGFQPEQQFSARPPPSFSSPAVTHLLPPFLAQSARLLPLTDRWAHPVSEPDRLLLRKSDRAPPPPPPPHAPATPTTPPLSWQNESAPLFLSLDSPFRLPISSPPETASPLKLHRAVVGYSLTARLWLSPAL
jgi:hypothetical protein